MARAQLGTRPRLFLTFSSSLGIVALVAFAFSLASQFKIIISLTGLHNPKILELEGDLGTTVPVESKTPVNQHGQAEKASDNPIGQSQSQKNITCDASPCTVWTTDKTVTRFSASNSVITFKDDQPFAPIKNETGGWILPVTRFTHHIMTLVENYNFSFHDNHWSVDLIIQSPDQVPVVTRQSHERNVVTQRYVDVFQKYVFPKNSSRVLPANASFCPHGGDMAEYVERGSNFNCFASSSPGGYSVVHNFEQIFAWRDNKTWPTPLPWNERSSKPVWRGVAWDSIKTIDPRLRKSALERIENGSSSILEEYINSDSHQKRISLVAYSNGHPELLDAKHTGHWFGPGSLYLWDENRTGGFQQLLPFHKIPPDEYYTKYQVHILMGGYGAAFRFPILLRQGIAVIVQGFPFEEWFLQYMEPFVHYVPLAQDLSNLTETLLWVRSNPNRVHQIALNGQEFFSNYLTYQHMESFYYELLFRMAHRREEGSHQQ